MRQDVLERLAAANIQLLPITVSAKHLVFERAGFVALVEHTEEGFGGVGSAGMLTEKGFAPLMQKGAGYSFVARGFERNASDQEVADLRAFQRDLEHAVR
jgi:hypothetical protein